MGEEDGGLLSSRVDDLEFWDYFEGDNMAQGAVRRMNCTDAGSEKTPQNHAATPFWNFYYTMFAGCGWGFSPKTKYLDQIVQTDGTDDYFLTHDTFSKLLFYCTYRAIIDRIWEHCTKSYHSIRALSDKCQGRHCIWLCANCPKEWSIPGGTALVQFLEEIENTYSIEECWFSSQKEFYLFDTDDMVTEIPYQFARYVGCHAMSNFTLSIQVEEYSADSAIRVLLFSEDAFLSKQLVDEISRRTTIDQKNFVIRCMD